MSENKSSKERITKRHWALIVYPESAPENWRDLLTASGLPCCISPIHDQDVNPTGEIKKEHWHVIVSYNGPTTLNNVKKLTDSLNAPTPQGLENVKGYYRYLSHKDNPEKAQYDEKDITYINGFNILDFVDMTRSEVLEAKKKIQTLIRDENIVEYCDLLDMLFDREMYNELDVAYNNTLMFNAYIKSRKYKGMNFPDREIL